MQYRRVSMQKPAIVEFHIAINVTHSISTTISDVTQKIDLGPLFHNIIHHQYYSRCIIAQPEPLTLTAPPSFD